ncbi:hypothetical protein GCM10010151_02470 [Actinoallomurus spadix]|uniref:DUF397 domain-containing protein n=1 Tax=Actinoallomurus spadix TaxID=79912 RepID=A0ABN0VS62_9ACTN
MTASDLAVPFWRKSTRSTDTGGACVEIAALWRKSSHSGTTGGQCVEVAAAPQVGTAPETPPTGNA